MTLAIFLEMKKLSVALGNFTRVKRKVNLKGSRSRETWLIPHGRQQGGIRVQKAA